MSKEPGRAETAERTRSKLEYKERMKRIVAIVLREVHLEKELERRGLEPDHGGKTALCPRELRRGRGTKWSCYTRMDGPVRYKYRYDGIEGDVVDLVMLMDGRATRGVAAQDLARIHGVDITETELINN